VCVLGVFLGGWVFRIDLDGNGMAEEKKKAMLGDTTYPSSC
jgi:hypothetical protein